MWKVLTLAALAATLAASACDDGGTTQGADTAPPADTTADTAAIGDTTPPADTAAPECPAPTGARPAARAEHAGIYDAAGHQLVLFGGSFGVPVNCSAIVNHTYEKDAWAYDLTCDQWRKLEGAGPAGRVRHSAVYDAKEHRMLIYGGRSRKGSEGAYTLYQEVWALDLETEAWSKLATTNDPDPRFNAAVVYDPADHRMLVFGGNTSPLGAVYSDTDEVWSLDLTSNSWSQVTVGGSGAPAARFWAAGVWDPDYQWFVIYGGSNAVEVFKQNAQYYDDMWALDFSQTPPTWLKLDTSIQKPIGRFWAGLARDAAAGRYVMFAGHDDQNLGNRNDLWALAPLTGTWELQGIGDTFNSGPTDFCKFPPDFTTVDVAYPERRHAHVFVGSGTKAWATGGKTDCGNVDDVFELDLATGVWTERLTATVGEACIRKGGLNCTDMCF